jgi:hypothetical protein
LSGSGLAGLQLKITHCQADQEIHAAHAVLGGQVFVTSESFPGGGETTLGNLETSAENFAVSVEFAERRSRRLVSAFRNEAFLLSGFSQRPF